MQSASQSPLPESSRQMLRHTLATLAYRAGKALRGAPGRFATFSSGEKGRTPLAILAHMGDLFDWALGLCKGEHVWHDSAPLPWPREVERFFAGMRAFDEYLGSGRPLGFSIEKLFQGPVATRSRIPAKLPCCVAWPAAQSKQKIISVLKSLPDVPVRAGCASD